MDCPSTGIIWHIGTIGFGYNDWRGGFYPASVKSTGYLAYYSRIFNAVEIDTSFHAVPKPETLRGWAEMTPDDFCFSLKMPKQITHQPDINQHALVLDTFLRAARAVGTKLGPILIQLPPSFRPNRIEELERFLSGLPGDLRYAVEVRHPSWYTREMDGPPELVKLLMGYKVCLAATEFPGLPVEIWQTADFCFVRWIGQNGSFARHTHIQRDRGKELLRWKELIQANRSWLKEIFGFFNNDYAGFPPGSANLFKQLMGLPVEPFGTPTQARLF